MLFFVIVKWYFLSLEKIKYFFFLLLLKVLLIVNILKKLFWILKKSYFVLYLRNIIFNVDKYKVWFFKWIEKYNLKFCKKNKIYIFDVFDYYIDFYIKILNIE